MFGGYPAARWCGGFDLRYGLKHPLSLYGRGYEDLAACCLVEVGEGERYFNIAPELGLTSPSLRLARKQVSKPSLFSPARGEK